jgi:hypothetical protein
MILAGVLGLPAVACSTACASLGQMAGAARDPNAAAGQTIMETLMWLAGIASLGSIIIGALVRRLGKQVSGAAALIFGAIFAALVIQANFFGLFSALMLLVAAIMIYVAPEEQFRSVTRVEHV